MKLKGEEHENTLLAASNYTASFIKLRRFEDAKALLRKKIPVAQRVLGKVHEITLRMEANYAGALYADTDATLDDLREAVTTLEEIERTTRRVLGTTHPTVTGVEQNLRAARATLRAAEQS